MQYKLGDTVILKDVDSYDEYNGLEFTIVNVCVEEIFQVKRAGFDSIWITKNNIRQEV